ncbi:MAG TPA: transcriptional regulator GutM [Pseudonocardia sp.]|uniref:transcriptional regulator GutM n=1 Tax=Pseudonocardia sp. TaxID=60912 RepID=UPI002B4B857E|nr:transcriptional regulator GutM [Pseudonocardia sp.]HLU60112.1 transcriptional regulator GutM [Pseudonocardia sp.]
MDNATVFVLVVAIMSLTGISAIAQHKYYARTVRRLAREHDEPGHVLVTGRGKSRFRGAIVVLVLRAGDEVIKAAMVLEGASVLARFKPRPDWVGRSAREPLPGASPRVAAAVAEARSRVPGRRVRKAPGGAGVSSRP